MKYIFCFLLFFSISAVSFAQGQSPNNVKWMELHTRNAKFIFPQEITYNAIKAANLIEYIYPYETKTLNTKPRKIPILLYNQSTVSNGFAGLRPRRSVWFSTPSQYATDLGTDDWFYTLGSHEFRHVVQYSKMNRHFTKLMSILLGQTGILMGEYSIPGWFFEGDAICAETGLSEGGRGRIPQFDMGIRTILLSDQKISYDKAKFGSYRTFYPGHYNFGWLMASQARLMFGADVFDKALNTTSKISFWPYAFSIGLKKASGLNERKMYKAVMNRLDSVWTTQSETIEMTEFVKVNTAEKDSWTRYSEPKYIDKTRILVKKSSMKSDLTSFYIIDRSGNETKLKATAADMIDVCNKRIVYALQYPDPRWQTRDYSDIMVMDLESKKETRLTHKQKLFAPSFSPDGKTIVVVEYNEKMKSSLVFVNSENGEIVKRIESPNTDFIRTPIFNQAGNQIVMTLSNETGTGLYILDLQSDTFVKLSDYSYENIGRPCFYDRYILYNSNYSGIDNIYAMDIETKEKYQVTSSKFGAYNPDVIENTMVYAEYSAMGYDVAEVVLDVKKFKPIEEVKKYAFETAEMIQKQEQNKNVLNPDLIPDSLYEVKPYRKLRDVVNIHSWQIFTSYPTNTEYISPDVLDQLMKPEIGVSIYSANVLNTVYGSVGGTYDLNEHTAGTELSLIFKKYYPEISISGAWKQRSAFYDGDEDRWEEYRSTLGFSVPLDFSHGIYYKGVNLSTDYSFVQNKGKSYRYISEPGEGNFSTLSYTGSMYAFRKQASRDINPKFGYFVYLSYNRIPFNQNINGFQFSSLASIYLPGAFRHHSLNIKLGYEKQRTYDAYDNNDYYWFSTPQSFPRGYYFTGFDEFKSASVNYALPVLYPDFNIGPFAYFKRVRANLFFDSAWVNPLSSTDETVAYRSAGLELLFQVYFLRLEQAIELGGRVSYLLDSATGESIVPEFLVLGVSF
jgi:hypothetical protein